MVEKNKKKTLTISSNLTKKIDFKNIQNQGKKSFSVNKKKFFKNDRDINKNFSNNKNLQDKNKKFKLNRKFIEQQATKNFIKKTDKPQNKGKLKLKSTIDKRDFKLTVSRALNVEEIEIKQKEVWLQLREPD